MDKFTKLIMATIAVVTVFTFAFMMFDHTHWAGLDNDNDSSASDKFFNRFYFTLTTFSSAGYGDISPKSKPARIISMIVQLLMTVAVLDFMV